MAKASKSKKGKTAQREPVGPRPMSGIEKAAWWSVPMTGLVALACAATIGYLYVTKPVAPRGLPAGEQVTTDDQPAEEKSKAEKANAKKAAQRKARRERAKKKAESAKGSDNAATGDDQIRPTEAHPLLRICCPPVHCLGEPLTVQRLRTIRRA